MQQHPHVSISYAHGKDDSEVELLVKRLIEEGVDCAVDFFDDAPPEGWPRRMEAMMSSGVVLLIASDTYLRRYKGLEESGKGQGAAFEANLLAQRVVEMQGWNEHVIPVLLREEDAQFIPLFLRDVTHYNVATEDDYKRLYLRLTNQHRVQRPALGKIREITPKQLGIDETPRYAEQVRGDRSFAYSQGGILIHSYVCTFSLAVHPVGYHEERYSRDDLPDLISRAQQRSRSFFPVGHGDLRRLNDGFQLITARQHYNAMEFREYYRIRRSGLFTLTFVNPYDIGPDRQYVGMERNVGFALMIEVLTKLARLAGGFVQEFGVESEGELCLIGLGGHRLKNDSDDPTLRVVALEADEDIIQRSLRGEPEQFVRGVDGWAVDVASEALAMLNFPYTDAVTRQKVYDFQQRLE